MLDTREIALETVPDGLNISARGERVAQYKSGAAPGFRSIRVAGRPLTHAFDATGLGVSISHGNICGIRFGSVEDGGDGASGTICTTGLTARRGSQSVGFRHDMDWQDPTGATLVNVAVVGRITPTPSMGAAIDLSLWFCAGEHEEVLLGQTDDSLLHLHLVPNLLTGGGGHIRNGFRDYDESGINRRRAPWFGCVGVIDSETVGISAIDHPDNPTHPPTWRARPGGSISLSAFETCSITLLPLESVTLRFRLQTHIGYVDEGWTSARAAEFAREPLRI